MLKYINNHANLIKGYVQPGIFWRNTANGNVFANIIAAKAASNDFALFEPSLVDPVDRKTVADFFKNDMLYEGFMATMLWGHKHLAKKPTAKKEFLSIVSTPKVDIITMMADVKKMVDNGDYKEAFESLYGGDKIKYVGEAFYTKLLYIMSYYAPKPLLILDSNMHYVWCALKIATGDLSYKTLYVWNSPTKKLEITNYNDNCWNTYNNFLNTMSVMTPKGARCDELEAFLFRNEPLLNEPLSPRQFVIDYIDKNY